MRFLLAGTLATLTAAGLAAIRPAVVSDEERSAAANIRESRMRADVRFLGSYPRADGVPAAVGRGTSNRDFADAEEWLARLRGWLHAVIALHAGKSPPRSWQIIGDLSRPVITG